MYSVSSSMVKDVSMASSRVWRCVDVFHLFSSHIMTCCCNCSLLGPRITKIPKSTLRPTLGFSCSQCGEPQHDRSGLRRSWAPKSTRRFPWSWGYPSSWMVYKVKSIKIPSRNGWWFPGFPHLWNPPDDGTSSFCRFTCEAQEKGRWNVQEQLISATFRKSNQLPISVEPARLVLQFLPPKFYSSSKKIQHWLQLLS